MKIRTLSIACAMTVAALFAGCTAVYKNTDACEQMMRDKLADVTPEQLPNATLEKLSVSHTGTGIHGSRVVVEGTLSHMQTASEVAAANPPKAASDAHAASVASAASAASAVGPGGAPAGASEAEGVVGAAASGAASVTAASAVPASGASATTAATKPAKPTKVTKIAAVECTFNGLNLSSFRWLAPAELVKSDAAGDSSE
jgi:hypothetical protein